MKAALPLYVVPGIVDSTIFRCLAALGNVHDAQLLLDHFASVTMRASHSVMAMDIHNFL